MTPHPRSSVIVALDFESSAAALTLVDWLGADASHYKVGLQLLTEAGPELVRTLLPGSQRRFVLLGIYGQAILANPALKLVVVHTAVGKDASGDANGNHLGAERDALFSRHRGALRGLVGARSTCVSDRCPFGAVCRPKAPARSATNRPGVRAVMRGRKIQPVTKESSGRLHFCAEP